MDLKRCLGIILLQSIFMLARGGEPARNAVAVGAFSTNSGAYFDWLEREFTNSVKRDTEGNVVRLSLPFRHVTDSILAMVSACGSITNLELHFTPSDYNALTVTGIRRLGATDKLRSLAIQCPNSLSAGMLSAFCEIRSLRSLVLTYANPPIVEYSSLTNLNMLESLTISKAPGFGDEVLASLRGMARLRELKFVDTAVSDGALESCRGFPLLTNVIIQRLAPPETIIWFKGER